MSTKSLTVIIKKFLDDSSRPYSVNDILEKCGKDYGKSSVQRSLDTLVVQEVVIEKQYGKQKIYFIKQQEGDYKSVLKDISTYEQNVNSLKSSLLEKENKMKKLESELQQFTSQPSLEDLEIQENRLTISCKKLNETLENIKSQETSKKFTKDEIKMIDEKHQKVTTAYRKRKRMCTDMVDAILEGYPKTKKHLIEEVGLETDESVNFKI